MGRRPISQMRKLRYHPFQNILILSSEGLLTVPWFLGHQYHLWPGNAQPPLPPGPHSTGTVRVTCRSLLPQVTASQHRGPGRAPAELTSHISSLVHSLPHALQPLPLRIFTPDIHCPLGQACSSQRWAECKKHCFFKKNKSIICAREVIFVCCVWTVEIQSGL